MSHMSPCIGVGVGSIGPNYQTLTKPSYMHYMQSNKAMKFKESSLLDTDTHRHMSIW